MLPTRGPSSLTSPLLLTPFCDPNAASNCYKRDSAPSLVPQAEIAETGDFCAASDCSRTGRVASKNRSQGAL